MAVDYEGAVVTYDGSSWSIAGAIGPFADLSSLTCLSSSFCMAVGAESAYLYDGRVWEQGMAIDRYLLLASVSCTSVSSCAAVDQDGYATVYEGARHWTALTHIDAVIADLHAVSCGSASFCVAIDSAGNAIGYDGTAWSKPTPIYPGEVNLSAVSCTSSSFCMAVDTGGRALIGRR
jgi:hypothetical protein